MSTEYDTDIEVGYLYTLDEVCKGFTKVTPEKFHLVDRFSEKTGKKIGAVKVVDEEEVEEFVLDGEVYDDYYEFLEAFTEKYDLLFADFGSDRGHSVVFYAELKHSGDDLVDGRVTIGGHIPLRAVLDATEEFERIKKALAEAGLPEKPITICQCASVG